MSIQVNQLVKTFGQQNAVNDLTFEAKKGEILGFLGPNGAGKSTTMKIITCYQPQTSGSVQVCGLDTRTHPQEIRKIIGYLPEKNPLYKDMYVREYLQFIAGIHQIDNKKSRIDEMIERTGLTRESKKIIGSLSKGYKQRVGLAQAMLHDPQVLILDEPTSGLDPNQLVDIRHLIAELGKEKTVIFSSHIMQEVQELCDRVVIINEGELVADDNIKTLQQRIKSNNIITLELENNVQEADLLAIEGIEASERIDAKHWRLFTASDKDIRKDIFQHCVRNDWTLLELHTEDSSVEDIFQTLTK